VSIDPRSVIAAFEPLVEQSPDNVPLRLHLISLLLQGDRAEDALRHCDAILEADPSNADALALRELAAGLSGEDGGRVPVPAQSEPEADAVDDEAERPRLTLEDVGGMADVKRRLWVSFLGPLQNPEARQAFRKSLRGGLLLYGPPGCGKTFIARATAGELGAAFFSVGMDDVLDMWLGQSERRLHELFDAARRHAPCVLFLDELDALGRKRTQLANSAGRGIVNQLLAELDGIDEENEGVFVLAATNHPWDVDSALKRPGRLDRMLLVLPPDAEAREAILRLHLEDRPVERLSLRKIVARTDGYSGADLAQLCEAAAELALADSIESGSVRKIRMSDLEQALAETRPSTHAWFQTARNYALFANEGGTYDDLLAYIRKHKLG
jgi:SpoVK/Ycf46/Vps4 family AAA+-type ATPase